jgi:NAD(P)-dependent dehydrogenase (short-subunit alcohol dehydrogenase family)
LHYVTPGTAILITGATGGIGFQIARQAAAAGALVGVHGSRSETVAAAVERLRAEYPNASLIPIEANFQQNGAVEAAVSKFADGGGGLDALIHCAIIGAPGASGFFRKTEPHSYSVLAALVLGVFEQLCFAAMPHLAVKGGTIVAFASDAGRFAAPRQTILGGAYGGIMTFVRNLAVEAARDNVRVHCISPSYVRATPIFERHMARGSTAADRAGLGLPSPKDIAPLALFLCGPDATKMTGQIISVNGGLNA